jgi:ATP-binding cassette, subfamily C (CFTR/MRP), member 1
MIYSKTLSSKWSGSQDAPVVSLMSADVGGITTTVDGLHDIWASMIEVGIGKYLLWVYAGLGFIVPLFLAAISMCINYFVVGKKMVSYRKIWNESTQQRRGLTGSALCDMKSLRMMGLGPRLQSLVQNLRIRELHRMKGLRWAVIWMNIIGGLARLFSTPFVLMVYSVRARASGWQPLKRRSSLHYSISTQSYHRASIHGVDKDSFHNVLPCVLRQDSAVSPSRGTSG